MIKTKKIKRFIEIFYNLKKFHDILNIHLEPLLGNFFNIKKNQ
jgi:hypothetical protein